jgi:hypothetical protein
MCIQFGSCIARMLPGDTIPGPPEIRVLTLEKGRDEIIFGLKVPIEAGFRYPGLLNNQINPHGSHPALIKEGARRLEDSLPHLSIVLGV